MIGADEGAISPKRVTAIKYQKVEMTCGYFHGIKWYFQEDFKDPLNFYFHEQRNLNYVVEKNGMLYCYGAKEDDKYYISKIEVHVIEGR